LKLEYYSDSLSQVKSQLSSQKSAKVDKILEQNNDYKPLIHRHIFNWSRDRD